MWGRTSASCLRGWPTCAGRRRRSRRGGIPGSTWPEPMSLPRPGPGEIPRPAESPGLASAASGHLTPAGLAGRRVFRVVPEAPAEPWRRVGEVPHDHPRCSAPPPRSRSIWARSASSLSSSSARPAGGRSTTTSLQETLPSACRRWPLTLMGARWRGRSSSSVGAVCAVGARRVGGAGPGSRSPWWSRIGCVARSSRGAWRMSGRSVVASSADHAWPPAADERAGHGLCAQFRAPTGSGKPTGGNTGRAPRVDLTPPPAEPSAG